MNSSKKTMFSIHSLYVITYSYNIHYLINLQGDHRTILQVESTDVNINVHQMHSHAQNRKLKIFLKCLINIADLYLNDIRLAEMVIPMYLH